MVAVWRWVYFPLPSTSQDLKSLLVPLWRQLGTKQVFYNGQFAGQAIPRGLHVRLNMETGKREARLMQEEDGSQLDAPEAGSNQGK